MLISVIRKGTQIGRIEWREGTQIERIERMVADFDFTFCGGCVG